MRTIWENFHLWKKKNKKKIKKINQEAPNYGLPHANGDTTLWLSLLRPLAFSFPSLLPRLWQQWPFSLPLIASTRVSPLSSSSSFSRYPPLKLISLFLRGLHSLHLKNASPPWPSPTRRLPEVRRRWNPQPQLVGSPDASVSLGRGALGMPKFFVDRSVSSSCFWRRSRVASWPAWAPLWNGSLHSWRKCSNHRHTFLCKMAKLYQ